MTFVKAQSAFELVNIHREWMKSNYVKEDKLLDEELLLEAAKAINDGLREQEAIDLLVLASKEVPDLNQYIEYLQSNEIDVRYSSSIKALTAIEEVSKEKFGIYSPSVALSRLFKLNLCSLFEDVTQKANEMIKDQEEAVKKNPKKENLALLYIMRMTMSDYIISKQLVDSPQYYDIILQTEKDMLEIFPLEDKTISFERAYLYLKTADAISSMSQPLELSMAQEKWGYQTMTYITLENGIKTNAEQYYIKAIEIFEELYSIGHPTVMNLKFTYNKYLSQNFIITEDVLEDIALYNKYSEIYYPKASIEIINSLVSLWETKMYALESVPEAVSRQTVIDELKNFLGEDSYAFFNLLCSIVRISTYQYPYSSDKIFDYFDSLVENFYFNEPLKIAVLYYYAYNIQSDKAQQRCEKILDKAYDLYLKNHNGSPLSIWLGRDIMQYSFYKKGNSRESKEIQECVCQDVKGVYGENSFVYFMEELNRISLTVKYDKKQDKLFEELIEKMQVLGLNYNEVLLTYADYVLNEKEDYSLAQDLYKRLLDKIDGNTTPEEHANYLLRLIYALGFESGKEDERASLYKQAHELLKSELSSEIIENYNYVALYLCDIGCFQEAIEALDYGLSLFDIDKAILNEQYLTLLQNKIDILYYNMNDQVTALRIMAGEYSQIDFDNPLNQTPLLLDYLWNCYYLIRNVSNYDITQLGKYYQPISKLTENLYRQGGYDLDFLVKYGSYIVQEMITIYIENKKNLDSINKSEIPQEFYEALNANLENLQQNFGYLKYIEEEFDNNNQYENESTYLNMLFCFAQYYYLIEKNRQKGLQYFKKFYSLIRSKSPSEAIKSLVLVGNWFLDEDEDENAEKCFKEALIQLNSMPSPLLLDKISIASALAYLYKKQGNRQQQLVQARLFYNYIREMLDSNFQLMTEQEQNSIMNLYGDPAGWLTSLLKYMPKELSSEVYDAVLYRTGMQLRSQIKTREAILSSGDAELINLTHELNQMQSQLRSLEVGLANEEQQKQNSIISSRINQLQQQIIEASEPYRQDIKDVTWQQIRDKLNPDEAAIEFVYSEDCLMALIIRSDSKIPSAVELTTAQELINGLNSINTKTSAKFAQKLYNDNFLDLYALLWEPMEEYLHGIKRIYFSTSGVLNIFSFAAFRLPDESYLMDKYDLHQLTSTQEIVNSKKESIPTSALVMGKIYYSPNQEILASSGQIRAINEDDVALDDFSRGMKADHFKFLSYTEKEIDDIFLELQKQDKLKGNITIKKEMDASEETFRASTLKSFDLIHLATHGFYIADDNDLIKIPFYHNKLQNMGSMRRSGVALSDAESTWRGQEKPEQEDGILTADEVSRMNLEGTLLVTLSACETALGNYTFEGVFGLPRGFKQAGVQSMLVSLWSVNDESTALLMAEFYKAWLGGSTKFDALQKARKIVRQKYPEPFYWAAFILLD